MRKRLRDRRPLRGAGVANQTARRLRRAKGMVKQPERLRLTQKAARIPAVFRERKNCEQTAAALGSRYPSRDSHWPRHSLRGTRPLAGRRASRLDRAGFRMVARAADRPLHDAPWRYSNARARPCAERRRVISSGRLATARPFTNRFVHDDGARRRHARRFAGLLRADRRGFRDRLRHLPFCPFAGALPERQRRQPVYPPPPQYCAELCGCRTSVRGARTCRARRRLPFSTTSSQTVVVPSSFRLLFNRRLPPCNDVSLPAHVRLAQLPSF